MKGVRRFWHSHCFISDAGQAHIDHTREEWLLQCGITEPVIDATRSETYLKRFNRRFRSRSQELRDFRNGGLASVISIASEKI